MLGFLIFCDGNFFLLGTIYFHLLNYWCCFVLFCFFLLLVFIFFCCFLFLLLFFNCFSWIIFLSFFVLLHLYIFVWVFQFFLFFFCLIFWTVFNMFLNLRLIFIFLFFLITVLIFPFSHYRSFLNRIERVVLHHFNVLISFFVWFNNFLWIFKLSFSDSFGVFLWNKFLKFR